MDNYKIKSTIDDKGPGKVFKVVKKSGGEIYAMKVIDIKKETDGETIKDELKLIKNISTMKHPNIVRYIDYFWNKDKNQCVIIMEYYSKRNLSKVIKKYFSMGEHIPQGQVLKYLSDILLGVESLHTIKLFHRDLRAENVLVGNDGNLKISGFGITRKLCGPKIHDISSLKNFRYMSCEVLNGEEYSSSADMWSIGCLLYELCSLELPYPEKIKDPSKYAGFIKTNKLQFSKIPTQYKEGLRQLIPIMLNITPALREDCTQLLKSKIFEYTNNKEYYKKIVDFDKKGQYNGG